MKKFGFLAILALSSSVFAESFATSQSVKVSRSEPIYKTVTTQRPIKNCWQESEQVVSGSSGNDVVGGLVGGAIGGALGSQVGKGSGKTAATIGGAIVGAMLGQGANSAEASQPRVVEKCTTKYETTSEQVLSGYNNFATYEGKQIVKFSQTPQEYIVVHTSVSY